MATQSAPTRTVVIGCGRMARGHMRELLFHRETTQIVAVCEPSPAAYAEVVAQYRAAGLEPPPNERDLDKLLVDFAGQLDAALIVTPHAYHYAQTVACLEAGLDVLLEKPMAVSGEEAAGLVETRDRTGRLLVVAFPGSLSPRIRTAVELAPQR